MKRSSIILCLLCGLVLPSLFAQVPKRAFPLSLDRSMEDVLPSEQLLRPYKLRALDLAHLHAEDARRPGARFAAPVKADFDLTSAGVWTELPDGGAVWKLKLEAPAGALGLIALYDACLRGRVCLCRVRTADLSRGLWHRSRSALRGILPVGCCRAIPLLSNIMSLLRRGGRGSYMFSG